MLELANTLLRKYAADAWCKGKGGRIVRDFPAPGAFEPDADSEVSVYHRQIWDEGRIRRHISSCKRKKDGKSLNHADFGLVALDAAAIGGQEGYTVIADPVDGNEFDPGNPAHFVIRSTKSKPEVMNLLYSLALGFSPPPCLIGVPVAHCPPWTLVSVAASA